MSPRIISAEVNILDGTLSGSLPLEPNLNLISGENGTLKTKLLQEIKNGRYKADEVDSQLRIQAISPKRNSERRTIDALVQQLRRDNRSLSAYHAERLGAQLVDSNFQNYASLGELFFLVYENGLRAGGNQKEEMEATSAAFNELIRAVFPEYRLSAEWDEVAGHPKLSLIKGQGISVPLDGLSLGEQDVLSMMASLYATREANDVYLIDEPECHLNWHLEEGLFEFFLDFSKKYQKQIIVVTHSRVVFTSPFLTMTTFLFWSAEGRVEWSRDIPDSSLSKLAGEAVQVIKLGALNEGTFFVEDEKHARVVRELAEALGGTVPVVPCGSSSNVRSLYRRSKSESGWPGAIFLHDGDNQGSPFPGDSQFIHLEKYCIENYFFDFDVGATLTGKSQNELRNLCYEQIIRNKMKILDKNKFLEFLVDGLKSEDITPERLGKLDASIILQGFSLALGLTENDYMHGYVRTAQALGKLAQVFPDALVKAIGAVAQNAEINAALPVGVEGQIATFGASDSAGIEAISL